MSDYAAEDSVVAPAPDVEMGDGAEEDAGEGGRSTLSFAEEGPEDREKPHTSFISYLTSPVVTLVVGAGESEAVLTAHQALLTLSPYFHSACSEFVDDGSPRTIDLADYDLDAVGCFLEFLYTGDYFPRKVPGQRALESDPSIPSVDEDGLQLLKHARVYTLSEKLQMPQLRNLSQSKIHCINSTAKGEIAYARYVYAFTSKDDVTVRGPVAHFWATRSHTLRSEAEAEFRSLCLEYPQFGYDVLTRVLDEKLKREKSEKMHPATGSARKRARHSSNA